MLESLYTGRRAHAFADALDEQGPGGATREGNEPAPDRPRAPGGTGPPNLDATSGDGLLGDGPDGEPDEPPDDALLALTERLRALPRPPGLRPAARAAQRDGLVAAMERATTEETPLIPRQRAVHRPHRPLPPTYAATLFLRLGPRARLSRGLAAGGLTLSVAVGAFGGAAAASADALPGDTLYGLKRGMEELRMELATTDTDRGRLHLARAARRLDEARALTERHTARGPAQDRTVDEVRQALTNMHHDAERGRRLLHTTPHGAPAEEGRHQLAVFAAEQRTAWEDLRRQLPAELHRVSSDVTLLLDALEDGGTPPPASHATTVAHGATPAARTPRVQEPPDPAGPDGPLRRLPPDQSRDDPGV